MKFEPLFSTPKTLLLLAIRTYQKTRLFRAPSCRFYPSCSQYMAGCVQQHGFLSGSLLALVRLAKCHPFNPGGVDEVPAVFHGTIKFKFKASRAPFSLISPNQAPAMQITNTRGSREL